MKQGGLQFPISHIQYNKILHNHNSEGARRYLTHKVLEKRRVRYFDILL